MSDESIHQRFAEQVARRPDAVAVTEVGGRQWTYGELDERANRLARRLSGLGVGRGEPVAVLLQRSADLVVAALAVVKAGACYLPLHTSHPPSRLQSILDEAGRPVLLADQAVLSRSQPRSRQAVNMAADTEPAGSPTPEPDLVVGPDDLACLMYTSGSQGRPSGVAITHRGVLSVALDPCWRTGAHQRVLSLAPFAFAVSIYEVWVPLLGGGELVLPPAGQVGIDALRGLIREHGITGLHLTAGLFRVVADSDPECLTGVREVLTGGDVISSQAVQRVLAACPDITVRAMYGATELSSFASSGPIRSPYEAGLTVPIGRPMTGLSAYIVDDELRPVPPGTVGHLFIAGERLARGYYGRPAVTAGRYVADPFTDRPGSRMYHTGDLARWTADGQIDFVGRATEQVKIRGFRVEPAEVEGALAEHPDVAHVVVVARQLGPDDTQLCAYVVGVSDHIDLAALRSYAAQKLPDYMVPATFTVLAALPLTPNGKVDRAALPEPAAPEQVGYRAPETPRQQLLCTLFAEVLGVARVGLDDSFFDLNGHSLLGLQLTNRIQTELGVPVSMADLFDAPTVAELDRVLDQARA